MSGDEETRYEERGDCVVIHAPDSATGVPLEYEYLEAKFGVQDRDWRVLGQRLERLESGGWADVVEIAPAGGGRRELRFDISAFFGLARGASGEGGEDDDAPTIGEPLGKPR